MSTPAQPMPEAHKGPLAWQQFGTGERGWCLTGQYGLRPIVLSVSPKGTLMLRDAATDRLVPFSPAHPDAIMLAASATMLAALRYCEQQANAIDETTIGRFSRIYTTARATIADATKGPR